MKTELKNYLAELFPDVKLSLRFEGDYLILDKIIVPEKIRGEGVGTNIIKLLINYSKENKLTLALTPSSDYGTSKTKLEKYYRKLGFIFNKGKNKDFMINATMYIK